MVNDMAESLLDNYIFSRRRPQEVRLPLTTRFHRPIGQLPKISPYSQRVIVKGAYTTPNKLSAHAKYLSRDGAGIEGEKPHFFEESKRDQPSSFLEAIPEEKRIFKFIISPENKIDDLETYTRDVMKQAGRCIREKIQWVGVVHENTDNHHVHVIVRGVTRDGKDLTIDPRFMRQGFRQICQDVATQELGYQTKTELMRSKSREINAERVTSLDRSLLSRQTQTQSPVIPKNGYEKERLKFLKNMGLVSKTSLRGYCFVEGAEGKLRELGRYGDIIKNVYSDGEITSIGRCILYTKGMDVKNAKVIKTGAAGDFFDRPYAVLGKDGKHIYLEGKSAQGLLKNQQIKELEAEKEVKRGRTERKKTRGGGR